jgi:hypothetical protein
VVSSLHKTTPPRILTKYLRLLSVIEIKGKEEEDLRSTILNGIEARPDALLDYGRTKANGQGQTISGPQSAVLLDGLIRTSAGLLLGLQMSPVAIEPAVILALSAVDEPDREDQKEHLG